MDISSFLKQPPLFYQALPFYGKISKTYQLLPFIKGEVQLCICTYFRLKTSVVQTSEDWKKPLMKMNSVANLIKFLITNESFFFFFESIFMYNCCVVSIFFSTTTNLTSVLTLIQWKLFYILPSSLTNNGSYKKSTTK